MVYLYTNQLTDEVSIVFDGNTLKEEEKVQAIQVEELPVKELEYATLCYNKETESVYWKEVVQPVNLSNKALQDIELMKQALNDLIFLGGM